MAKNDYSVPAEIRAMKPKGTIVKKLNGRFYVYEHFCIKDESTGKWKTKSGRMIGRIDEKNGFIPNDSFIGSDKITELEYGQYALAYHAGSGVLDMLKKVFNPIDAKTIYFMALCSFVNEYTYLRDYSRFFEQCYLSLEFGNLSMSRQYLSEFIDNLGRRQTRPLKFQQMLIDQSSKELAIDGHVMRCCSDENDLADKGNKFNKIVDTQINLLAAYDVNSMKPVFAKFYAGSTLDKTSVQDVMKSMKFSNVLFIVDRGFYSSDNTELFTQNGCNYIIPLSANLNSYKSVTESMQFDDHFLYAKGKHHSRISYIESEYDGKRIIVYRDEYENMADVTDYEINIEKDPKKYTKERLEEIKDYFGMIVLQTSYSKEERSAKEIYNRYKKRWRIENFYNYVKNTCRIESLHQQDYYKTQGLAFIFLVTGLIESEYAKRLKNLDGVTMRDMNLISRMVKLSRKGNRWVICNVKKSAQEKMEKFGFDFKQAAKHVYEYR